MPRFSVTRLTASALALYEWFSVVFKEDTEASGLFFRMAMQEKSHANLVRYGKKMVRQSPIDSSEIDLNPAEIEELLDAIQMARQHDPSPSLEQAIGIALYLEDSPAESAHRSILMHANSEVAGLIRSLVTADDEHVAGLRAFAE